MYSSATKGGRLASTAHRGHLVGQVVHAIPGTEENGFWDTPALCKAKPGNRGYGWLGVDNPVTCPKCLKAIGRTTKD